MIFMLSKAHPEGPVEAGVEATVEATVVFAVVGLLSLLQQSCS